jgi:hypothetical protein
MKANFRRLHDYIAEPAKRRAASGSSASLAQSKVALSLRERSQALRKAESHRRIEASRVRSSPQLISRSEMATMLGRTRRLFTIRHAPRHDAHDGRPVVSGTTSATPNGRCEDVPGHENAGVGCGPAFAEVFVAEAQIGKRFAAEFIEMAK